MSVKTNQYISQIAQDTGRGPSNGIWGDCPLADLRQGGISNHGVLFEDDFNMVGQWATTNTTGQSMGQWGAFGSTGALPVDAALEGGVLGLNADGDQESATIASTVGAFKIVGATPYPLQTKLWFEARVAVGTIAATKMDVFCGLASLLTSSGLMTNTLPISTTDDTLSTVPHLIGFHKKSGASTDWTFVFQVAGGTAVYPTGLTTLVVTVTGSAIAALSGQTGFVKLGFVFDPERGNSTRIIGVASTGQTLGQIAGALVKVFVNGQMVPAFLTSVNVQGATFPTGFMGPVFSVMQTATGANTGYIDWIRVAQISAF